MISSTKIGFKKIVFRKIVSYYSHYIFIIIWECALCPYFRESTLEVTKGIREYFNITLGLQLLYKWERPQFIQIMNDNPETLPSQLYGAFHLLRLFGKYKI